MRAHDRVRNVDELLERAFGRYPWGKGAAVVVAVHRAQPDERDLAASGSSSSYAARMSMKRRVAARARRQFPGVEHGRRGRPLGVRVVGVERLEQPGPLCVETAEREITELRRAAHR